MGRIIAELLVRAIIIYCAVGAVYLSVRIAKLAGLLS